ncbi:c-type cytochrome [Mariprofundus erugo]|uniref:C-type cytochrome n=1 Tax=Mariprofundus erugo TaxID=2528639 RepID=A0A5R9GI67_9PROT|nr:c-type cytochrome [Mariprofundus erugo]TLS66446.1 c-type cytochrome [Mariprofundus erugo]TLS77908.1 c-type cytochrome [Mariprofundus erugo]
MKRMISTMGAFALLAWFAAPTAASAEETIGNVDNGRLIFQNGKGDNVPACQGCHGIDGNGNDEVGSPRLSYQVDTYILKQLTDFSEGKRTDFTMYQMNDIAKALTEQERKDVAAYVHTLKSPYIGSNLDQLRRDGATVGNPHDGKMIAEYGAPDHGIPACKSCHGYHGRSAGRMYPAIGGQNYVYLKSQLEAFRNGANTSEADIAAGNREDNARVNDYMAQMRNVAKNMSDEDIANVAAFLTLAKPNSPGNPRTPSHQ